MTRFELTDLPFLPPSLPRFAMKKGLDVFDFTEEDELPELISEKHLTKFKNPNLESNAVFKYEFLECGMYYSTLNYFILVILIVCNWLWKADVYGFCF